MTPNRLVFLVLMFAGIECTAQQWVWAKIVEDKEVYNEGIFSDTLAADATGSVYSLRVHKLSKTTGANIAWSVPIGGIGEHLLVKSSRVYITGVFTDSISFGGTWFYNNNQNYPNAKYLACYSTAGQFMWAQTFDITHVTELLIDDLAADNLGNIYLATSCYGSFSVAANKFQSDGWNVTVLRFNSSGKLDWFHSVNKTGTVWYPALAVDHNNNVIIAANFMDSVSFDKGGFKSYSPCKGFASTCGDIFVAKFDPSGKNIWAKRYGQKSDFDYVLDIAVSPNNEIFLTAWSRDTIFTDSKVLLMPKYDDYQTYVLKMRSDGSFAWLLNGGSSNTTSSGYRLIYSADGYIYVKGYITPPVGTQQGTVAFGSNLMQVPYYDHWSSFMAKITDQSNGSLGLQTQETHQPTFWPNPTDGLLFITHGRSESYLVFDVFGNLVSNLTAKQNSITLAGLKPGVYLIVSSGDTHYRAKIVLQ